MMRIIAEHAPFVATPQEMRGPESMALVAAAFHYFKQQINE